MPEGIYLYCLTINNSLHTVSQLTGIDGQNPIYSLKYQELTAIVSGVSLEQFGEESLTKKIQNLSWLEEKVYLHQAVIEQALKEGTVLPMKFCTIFSSEDRLREALKENYKCYVNIVQKLTGKEEWGLKIFFNPDLLKSQICQVSNKVKELKEQITVTDAGKAYLLQKKLNKMISEEINAKSTEFVQDSWEKLLPWAEQAVQNNLVGQEVSGRKEENIMNAVFLVAKEKLLGFNSIVHDLASQYGPFGLELVLSGPWPPYNFTGGVTNVE